MTMRNVIIDCDPGIDDSLAIMLALKSPELNILGITVVSGNVAVDAGIENAKKILSFMGRLDIPVFRGEAVPLKRDYVSATETHGTDGLGETFFPNINGYEQKISAQDFIIQKLNEQKLSIIALAPMTNIARAIQKDEKAFENLEEIVSMGGNFKSFGNCSPVAEYNYWCDPDAAAFVYDFFYRKSKIINMVGLDVTRKIVLTPTLVDFIYRINNRIGEFVKKITAFYMDFHWEYEKIIGSVINDPLAVAWFIDRSLCDGIMAFTQVETSGLAIGQTIVDANNFLKKAPNSLVLTSVDSEKFIKTFIAKITDNQTDTEKYWIALQGAL
ncbi:MAG: nucleoside hydrolase [Candidatus Riflebacteria bacterium]|nr:nucleoside hydrolase [Candidatus Riflebacteria bacterium]